MEGGVKCSTGAKQATHSPAFVSKPRKKQMPSQIGHSAETLLHKPASQPVHILVSKGKCIYFIHKFNAI